MAQWNGIPVAAPRDGRAIWTAVDRLIDSTTDLGALRANRIHLLAARHWRELGREVPSELEAAERKSVLVTLILPELLGRVRAAFDGPLVVHKGPEIADRYPDPALRPYIDLDVLVPAAKPVQRALVDVGFVEVGDPASYTDSPHCLPLLWPGLPLLVEVHDRPNWPARLGVPPARELLEHAVPSSLGVEGVLTLAPAHHALVVAAHSWAHGPMARVGDLVDVAVMADALDRDELCRLARRWGLERLWRTTLGTAEAVLFGDPKPWALRVWARNLSAVRERSVLENHIGLWLAGFSALGASRGALAMVAQVGQDLRPVRGETWGAKLSRTRAALRDARVKKSVHDEQLERAERRR